MVRRGARVVAELVLAAVGLLGLWRCAPLTLIYFESKLGARTPEGNHLPPVLHVVKDGPTLQPGRLILVGDIHGCLDELEELMDRVKLSPHDNLVFLGDLVNKGPKSKEVLQASRRYGALVLRGNHDEAVLAGFKAWKSRGVPLDPRFTWAGDLDEEDIQQLESLPFSATFPGYRLLATHAGVVPGIPLEKQNLKNLITMRDMMPRKWHRWFEPNKRGLALSKKPPPMLYNVFEKSPSQLDTSPWGAMWAGPWHVVFGHDAKRRLQTYTNATGIDTGCCFGGALTACVFPPLEELQQSDDFRQKVARGEPMDLQTLQGKLISVAAHKQYALKDKKKKKKAR